MKRCPKCNLLFDDSLGFCLEDGTVLIAAPVPSKMVSPTLVVPTTEAYPASPIGHGAAPNMSPSPPAAETVRFPARNPTQPFVDPAGSTANAMIIWFIAVITALLVILRFAVWGSVAIAGAPMMTLCLVGLLAAIMRRRVNPQASLLTALGLGLFVLRGSVTSGISAVIPKLESSMHFTGAQIATAYLVLDVLDDFVYAVVIVFLVAAAFANRKPHPDGNDVKEQLPREQVRGSE